jgi:hypothetical protein
VDRTLISIFGSKVVTGRSRKVLDEQLHNLRLSPKPSGDERNVKSLQRREY